MVEWVMLNESKKLFPHWLDKSEDSNFSKHLKIINNQQLDIRHKLKTIEWSKLLNKPIQIHKTQTEPYKWKIEFEVNVPRLKKVNIYKNPTIVNNKVVNSLKVINGYYYEGSFYENHSTEVINIVSDLSESESESDEDNVLSDKDLYDVSDSYNGLIEGETGKYYCDLITGKYYKYINNHYSLVNEEEVPRTSLIHSESFIDNYSHFFRHIIYEENTDEVFIQKYVVDDENNQKYKIKLNYSENENISNNGKYELHIVEEKDSPKLYYNITDEKYYIFENNDFVQIEDEKIIKVDNVNEILDDNNYYIFTNSDDNSITSRIPLIETENITPIICNDKYVLEVITWNDFHFLKGFPEIDFIDYNNNNIIDEEEKTYDNLHIEIENIGDKEYLTFRIHQFGIKLIEIFKDEKPIHKADFIIEKLGYDNAQLNDNFAHIYNYDDNEIYFPYQKDTDVVEEVNLDVDKYVWRLPITEEDKIYDENDNFELKNKYDLQVTYYNSLHPFNSEYDKILRKTYVCEDSIFYHDVSLDMIGKLFNLNRYVYKQPVLETNDEKIEYYSNTYPTYCNTLSEDDYHYQKRLEYYINNYNKIYFPCLELWKYFHIDSELVNRKVIVAEQNYSYLRELNAEEDKYINELGRNKAESFYLNEDYVSDEEESNLNKPKIKATITSHDYTHSRNGILVNDRDEYIRDIYGTPVRIDYNYYINENGDYVIRYEEISKKIYWYNAKHILNPNSNDKNYYQIKLIDSLDVVPNTRYQLRFCVKEYPKNGLNLRVIYKNRAGDVREIIESTPLRKDYDEIKENNELIYTDYNKEWEISCEYICTDFLTLPNAQNIEICLESIDLFKISDVTLQRITINHFDAEYMKTSTDYNSCVYDLYADFNEIPSNLKYTDLNIFNKILNRSLPLAKKGYFNFALKNTDTNDYMNLSTETNIYIKDMMEITSNISVDNASVTTFNDEKEVYEYEYQFNRYVKNGEYEIYIKPYYSTEQNVIHDIGIGIDMIIFTEDNHAVTKTLQIDNLEEYYIEEDECFKIPFMNESDNSFKIRIYRKLSFDFKDFKLIRKDPLTMEEITK